MRSSLSPVFSKFTLLTAREGLPHTTPRPGALCWDTPGNPFQLRMPIQSPTRKSSHISPKPPAPLTPAACGFAPVPRPTPAPLTCQKEEEEERGKHYTPGEVPLRPAAPPHLLHAGCMRRATVRLLAGAGQYGGVRGQAGSEPSPLPPATAPEPGRQLFFPRLPLHLSCSAGARRPTVV